MPTLKAIPTNVITGFLGVGKSTAILELLKRKPEGERWAVLVNEFGEVGIDGSLFSGQESEQQGVFVREVPGGCMCCAAGLPMQIALNMLLARSKPDRLLIEPTGLGHPREVLEVLGAEHYREVLDLRATLTLVDARKISDERYTSHATFNQQLAVADVIVANKSDQYQPGDFQKLVDYLESEVTVADKSVHQVSHGQLQLSWLQAPASQYSCDHHHHHASPETATSVLESPQMPAEGYLCIDNQGEGFFSRGWIFSPEWVFDGLKLSALLMGVEAERIKGVFVTEQGIIAFNKADGVLTESQLDDSLDSRIECIGTDRALLESLEAKLLDCGTRQ
ncbi:GTP-binding protein [Pseudomaricurvus alkylphenolicus]|uniref:CobW family GTP-binding protein n=1 Tax=Pseudomaricurvus alkylphenolicus TaxID=1306991 RepID=UPI001422CEA3|nr:GTP-binding protein [Pseudomaricurvus alkylphenolicus]NIB40404.1 GTP-binding protein [Pseudomaricurvus alkylphenolicus]